MLIPKPVLAVDLWSIVWFYNYISHTSMWDHFILHLPSLFSVATFIFTFQLEINEDLTCSNILKVKSWEFHMIEFNFFFHFLVEFIQGIWFDMSSVAYSEHLDYFQLSFTVVWLHSVPSHEPFHVGFRARFKTSQMPR